MRKLSLKHIIFTITIVLLATSLCKAQDSTYVKEGTIKVQTSESIKRLIAKKRSYNRNLKTVQGYKIQIYYGTEEDAIKKMDEFKIAFPDVGTELKFTSPDWKVWVGNYKTRLEVDRNLVEVKKEFPSAIPVATKVKI